MASVNLSSIKCRHRKGKKKKNMKKKNTNTWKFNHTILVIFSWNCIINCTGKTNNKICALIIKKKMAFVIHIYVCSIFSTKYKIRNVVFQVLLIFEFLYWKLLSTNLLPHSNLLKISTLGGWSPTYLWCWEALGIGGERTTEDEMVGWHHRLDGHEFV